MAANLILTMAGALLKHKLHVGTLSGLERFMLSSLTLPDRVTTLLGATNIEPELVDPKFDYVLLAESVEANLELFELVRQRVKVDMVVSPIWQGLMFFGTAELGTVFKIEKRRVPYSVEYPIKTREDVDRIKPPQQAAGHLKMYFDISKELQRRHPDSLFTLIFDGPWDLAMLLRGDRRLPADLRIHRDYVEAKNQAARDKIRRFGDPDMYPAIMELTTQVAIRHIQLAAADRHALMGAQLVDQYAAKPIMSREDYFKYVHPYRLRVWQAVGKKVGLGYFVPSPQEIEQNLQDPVIGKGMGAVVNYIFPQTPEGVTLPEYDRPALELARRYKQGYTYFVHGKYLRDASEAQLEALMQRVCGMAVEMRARLGITIASVPPGSSLEKANLVFQMAEKYGRY